MGAMWFKDLLATFRPGASQKDGPLPPLLLALTLLTGLVDALSYLVLGHVFVANMTGNVVFLGFALPGVGGFWAPASIAAIAAFGVGALAGGRWIAPARVPRAAALWRTTACQALLGLLAWGAWAVSAGDAPGGAVAGTLASLLVIVPLAVAMGLQNHTARSLKVADRTTTVLTLTITGLFADSSGPGGAPHQGRRLLSILAMGIGAALGAWAVLGGLTWLVFLGCVLLPAAVAVAAWRAGRSAPAWSET